MTRKEETFGQDSIFCENDLECARASSGECLNGIHTVDLVFSVFSVILTTR